MEVLGRPLEAGTMLGQLFSSEPQTLFLNEGTSYAEYELGKLEALRGLVSDESRESLERDILITKAGIAGERQIAFELQNSHYPLVFIHDLQLELKGLRSQIDYLVITPYNAVVIECKNLIGDITVDREGTFVRSFGSGRYRQRTAIYSPITQNERHIQLMKAIVREGRNPLEHLIQNHILDNYYHSVVVLANKETILSARQALRAIRDKVVRADRLVAYLKRLDQAYAKKNPRDSFKSMRATAEWWLSINKPKRIDLSSRYVLADPADTTRAPAAASPANAGNAAPVPLCPFCGAPMVLRTARRGAHAGQQFWGCSNFGITRCGGIINIVQQPPQ